MQQDILDAAYRERNLLVRYLATLFPSGIRRTEIEGWDPEWNNCVFIDTPEGQMSWHYHEREGAMFKNLPPYKKEWDGHTTEEKYKRLQKLFGATVILDPFAEWEYEENPSDVTQGS